MKEDSGFVWTPDDEATFCALCSAVFGFFNRKHHCRKCGKILCNKCTPFRMKVPENGFNARVRVCTKCSYESMQPPKLITSLSQPELQTETYVQPLNDEYTGNLAHNPSYHSQSFTQKSPRHSISPTHKSQPLPARAQSMYFPKAPRPPSLSSFQPIPALPTIPALVSSSSIPPPPSSPASLRPQHFNLPTNWHEMEPIHFGPSPTAPCQYQIPVGSKRVELPGDCALYRGLKGFTYKPANGNPIPLNITLPYVPPRMLAALGGSAQPIVKTGPALCMAPGVQNWARGMVCVDATRVHWRAREGEPQSFALTAEAVLAPVDRGGQVRGIVSKADGILGIADKVPQDQENNNQQTPRTIWYFHFPSREIRNTWRFAISFNIAQSLSRASQFELVRDEFVRVCTDKGVQGVMELDWHQILDVLYSDD